MKPGISYSSETKTITVWLSDRIQTIKNVDAADYPNLAAFIHNLYLEGHNDCLDTMDHPHGY